MQPFLCRRQRERDEKRVVDVGRLRDSRGTAQSLLDSLERHKKVALAAFSTPATTEEGD